MRLNEPPIKIPRRFYDDHVDRDLPAPRIAKETKANYWVYSDENIRELLSDAKYYDECLKNGGWQDAYVRGIALSARATRKAIERHAILWPLPSPA